MLSIYGEGLDMNTKIVVSGSYNIVSRYGHDYCIIIIHYYNSRIQVVKLNVSVIYSSYHGSVPFHMDSCSTIDNRDDAGHSLTDDHWSKY